MRSYHAKIKNHTSYNPKEIMTILVYAILIAFIFSFNQPGTEVFDLVIGLFNLGYFFLVSLFILVASTYIQKIVGAHIGIIPTFHFSVPSFVIAGVILVLTSGTFPFFIPPGFTTNENLSQMLGRNRYRRGFVDYLQISIAGIFFLVLFGLLFSVPFLRTFFPEVHSVFFYFALFSLIPFDIVLKPFDKNMGVTNGSGILFCSRSIYVFCSLFLLVGFILSFSELFFISVLLAVSLAFIGAIVYFLYEQKVFG